MRIRDKEKTKAYNALYRAANKDKIAAYDAAYYAANKEKSTARGRLRLTGVTQEQYDEAYLKQKGVCALCSCGCSSGKQLAADHCHTTGIFRGLLCGNCNRGLGNFKDNPDLLKKAIGYLYDT